MLKVGDILTIEIKGEHYKSKVVDIRKDAVYMNDPVHTISNRTVFLRPGTEFAGNFINDNKQVYYFQSIVLERKQGGAGMVVFSNPEKFIPIQRREFLRVNSGVDVAVHPLNKEFPPFVTVTCDLSAGGASIVVPKEKTKHFINGLKIRTWFVLPMQSGEYYYLKLTAKVIRTFELNERSNGVSLQFEGKSKKEEQQLLKYCFEYQLLMKQKESNR